MNATRRQFLQAAGIGVGILSSGIRSWAAQSDTVDALVIGSGFGGAIAALRLAKAGINTVVLERGRRWPIAQPDVNKPNYGQDTFATFEKPDGRAAWLSTLTTSIDNPPLKIDKYTGVLELIGPSDMTGPGQPIYSNGMVVRNGAGVGGGSLAYNAILLQPRRELFRRVFPASIDYDEMASVYYPRVRAILNGTAEPNYLPGDILSSDFYKSTRVNLQQAINAGLVSNPPKLVEYGVNFDIVRREIVAAQSNMASQNGSRPSAIDGQSWYGLNSGAKNSVDHNYLAMAEATGKVQVLPLHVVNDVSYVPSMGMYIVFANEIDTNGVVQRSRVFTTRRLFMAAGSMGTSALLVKAKAKGTLPRLRNSVGTAWGSNGDFILFRGGLGDTNSGTGGPCGHFVIEKLNDPDGASDAVELVVPKPQAFPGSSLYVGLGVAPPVGQFSYSHKTDSVTLDWPRGNNQLVPAVNSAMRFEQALNASNPGSFTAFSSTSIPPDLTAHPVGGAVMGKVCDQFGRVRNYPGLYIVDGAIIPGGSVGGVNPSLTISAIAERSMDTIIKDIMNGVETGAKMVGSSGDDDISSE